MTTRCKNPRVEALRKTAKFLYCVAEGAPTTSQDFKLFSDLCWLTVPMKYRMSKAEIEEIKSHPWANVRDSTGKREEDGDGPLGG